MLRYADGDFWIRSSKALLALIVGMWALAAAYGNVADYGTNWIYVQNIMSMSATQDDPIVAWRAIDDPAVQRVAYAAIIVGEAVAGAFFILAGILMGLRIGKPSRSFQAAKAPYAIGLIAALLVWLFGFMVVAGEWFQMWRSPTYNAQQSAFMFYATMLLAGVYIFQKSEEPLAPPDSR
ncbi:DUF2165 family protein [Roseibium sp. SCP14]|uniref:DUF2165 family protein n=1 Tax=Roseibium sp. SCP14 TaxID=3141375 RepID=UPI00333CC70F